MAANITEPPVGASTCASGNQVCTGHMGIFTENAAKKRSVETAALSAEHCEEREAESEGRSGDDADGSVSTDDLAPGHTVDHQRGSDAPDPRAEKVIDAEQ